MPDVVDKPDAPADAADRRPGRVRSRRRRVQAGRAACCAASASSPSRARRSPSSGPTGAGKTTIINLIPRFYDVTGGAVRIDGLDVRDVTRGQPAQADRHRAAGHLPVQRHGDEQHPLRPARTRPTKKCWRPRSWRAPTSSSSACPTGYDTVLGERGSGLSQGQRQLLAIARAALADPRILILDEATSSVDTRTERQIQQALDDAAQGPHELRHRPPPEHHPQRRPGAGAGGRRDRRARQARRAAGARGARTTSCT